MSDDPTIESPMKTIAPIDAEALASSLEATGEYRVLRRLRSPPASPVGDGPDVRRGLFVDVETTGLDPDRDEIIELAVVEFHYAIDGRIVGIGEIFEGLREPSVRIPLAITALTGITDEMVVGKSIDLSAMRALVADADLDRSQCRLRPPLSRKVGSDLRGQAVGVFDVADRLGGRGLRGYETRLSRDGRAVLLRSPSRCE